MNILSGNRGRRSKLGGERLNLSDDGRDAIHNISNCPCSVGNTRTWWPVLLVLGRQLQGQ
jgi:hypothetical protein